MDGPVHYPLANRDVQWFGDVFPGGTMVRIDKLLLHTTETGGWPGYEKGAKAPTLTYHPVKHTWRQHFKINQSARGLRDPDLTVVRENRANVVQVEIVCACDAKKAKRDKIVDVRDLDERAIRDLAEFAAWLHHHWGLPLVLTPDWLPFPESAGRSKVRMTGPEYANFKGILGHQHAPAGKGEDLGNEHGDPGALDVRSILAFAQDATPGARMQERHEEEEDVKPTDIIGFDIDPETKVKTPVTLEVFFGRMNWMYQQMLEGGKVDSALDRIEKAVKQD